MAQTQYRVKFASHEQDLVLSFSPTEPCARVVEEVRRALSLPASKHVRLICGGKELHQDVPLSTAVSPVLHCMIADSAATKSPHRPTRMVLDAVLDWLDALDPLVALKWVLGSVLGVAWLVLCIYPGLYDRNSAIVLSMMTLVCAVPLGLGYCFFPAGATGPGSAGSSSSGHPSASVQSAETVGGMVIPPRPHARVRGPFTADH